MANPMYGSNSFDAKLDDLQDAQSAEADVTLTQTDNAVSANGSVTVADGSSATNAEIYELAVELHAKLNAVLAKLRLAGIIAS